MTASMSSRPSLTLFRMSSASPSSMGEVTSRSSLIICWPWLMTLVLSVVGLSGTSRIPSTPIPLSLRRSRSSLPGVSRPTIPKSSTSEPSARRLRATLAAPPGLIRLPWIAATGTGASGEIRSTSPKRYSSRMRSPITATRRSLNFSMNLSTFI